MHFGKIGMRWSTTSSNRTILRKWDNVIGRYFLHGHLQFNCPVEDAYKFNTPLANLLRKNLPYKKEWISQAERALQAQLERLWGVYGEDRKQPEDSIISPTGIWIIGWLVGWPEIMKELITQEDKHNPGKPSVKAGSHLEVLGEKTTGIEEEREGEVTCIQR